MTRNISLYEAMDILDDHDREPGVYWDDIDVRDALAVVADDADATARAQHIDVAGRTCYCDRCTS